MLLLTSVVFPPKLWRDAVAWLARSSLCLLSSASFALFARISSLRCCCILLVPQTHLRRRSEQNGNGMVLGLLVVELMVSLQRGICDVWLSRSLRLSSAVLKGNSVTVMVVGALSNGITTFFHATGRVYSRLAGAMWRQGIS